MTQPSTALTQSGMTQLLSKSLDSRALAEHRAAVAFELEVIAKKLDRFGWERDRGTKAHDRLMTDWMDVLQDYPLNEVKAACVSWVLENPSKTPNEGHIRNQIRMARRVNLKTISQPEPEREPPATKEQAADILKQAGASIDKNGRVTL